MSWTGGSRSIVAVAGVGLVVVAGMACSRSSPTAVTSAPSPPPAPTATPSPSPTPSASPSPANPASLIAEVRVAFFGIRCDGGAKPPGNTKKILPLGCTGVVTATPKMSNEADLPQETPGLQIEWSLSPPGNVIVRVTDFPGQPFNKNVTARRLGPFALCAVVNGVQGCLNGVVVG